MPTYAYACTECSHRFDAVQSFADDALTDCPECTGRLRKLFSSVGIVFKGSGFYRTDSRAQTNGANGSKPKETKEPKENGSSASKEPATASAGSTPSSSSSSSKTDSKAS